MRAAAVAAVALAALAVPRSPAAAPAAGPIAGFGPSLVDDCPFPEGIAVDPRGFVYASSFAFAPVANVCVLDRDGRLVGTIPVPAASATVPAALLGMLFVPGDGLYVADFADGAGHGRLLRIDGAGEIHTVASGFAAPNAIALDHRGSLYVSDSFAGTITRIDRGGALETWASDPRLATAGQPPFGANGLAFDRAERWLYVANTGDDAVLRIPVRADGSAGEVEVFAQGAALGAGALDGADGLAFDAAGNLWVCANQADELHVLSPEGALVARHAGAGAAALDFPASLAFDGRTLYVTNLSLFTGGGGSRVSSMRAPLPGAPVGR